MTAVALACRLAAFGIEPALHRRPRRLGLMAGPRDPQRGRQPALEALQGKLAVAGLAALVLRHGDDARAQPRDHAALLFVSQCGRSADVEDRLDARGGDV